MIKQSRFQLPRSVIKTVINFPHGCWYVKSQKESLIESRVDILLTVHPRIHEKS